jgi:thioredoxin 1
MREVGLRNFSQEVVNKPHPVLVDFYSDSCVPCRHMLPILAGLEARGYPIVKVNIEDEPELASHFKIESVPTMLLINGHEVVRRTVGLKSGSQVVGMFAEVGVG